VNHLFKEAIANSQCILDSAHHQGGQFERKETIAEKG